MVKISENTHYIVKIIKLLVFMSRFQNRRTKWKRQNSLRLEQLRHQAVIDKELLSSDNG